MARLSVEIVTAERRVLSDEVDMVIAPAVEGTVGILPRHAPLLTSLRPGVMVLKRAGEEEVLAVSGGFLQVSNNRVLILADTAERAEEVDEARAEQARAEAEVALREASSQAGGVQTEAARTALRRSLARLQVTQRRKQRRTST
ncbi:MAG: F0F1 ATP synthase subunit epsilon [Chloroflexi bacterium]|nr:F0F1 ATP synthase subunit epsilon [Chloroflexota bacterium]